MNKDQKQVAGCRICVVGSSNTDMVVNVARLPKPGETLLGRNFMMNGGGKGANQAVAAARLGASVTLVCKIGEDMFGQAAMDGFQKQGIETRYIMKDAAHASGVALIDVDDQGENSIVVAPGANGNLLPADLEAARQAIADSDILLLQLEIPLESVVFAARLAFDMDKYVILNPAPTMHLSADLLRYVSLLTPNEIEATQISGVTVTDAGSAREAALKMAQMGVPRIIITRGDKGALIFDQGAFEEIPAVRVAAVDTTAAGDVFNGALAVALAEGNSLRDAASFAARAAAISVTRRGAQSSAPYRHEL